MQVFNLSTGITDKLKKIKLVIFDIDGVLTDGTLYYSSTGEELKAFNVKDGVGIKMLLAHDIHVAVISAKSSAPLSKRMSDLGITLFFPATKDKFFRIKMLMSEYQLHADELAFVGDDMIDLLAMRQVGVSFTPADGFHLVRQEADIVTQSSGGKGVAREVADMILSTRGSLSELYQIAMLAPFEEKQLS